MRDLSYNTLPGAGPFYFKGNKTGLLMLPGGGGGTCADLKYIAEDIYRKTGYTIHIPLLPGFGTSPKDLKNTPLTAWKRALEKEYLEINKESNKVLVGGHSMGGILAFIFASHHQIDGLFSISTPIGLKGFAPKLVPFLKIFMKYHSIDSENFKIETGNKWVGYDKIPLNQATKINKLIKQMKQVLYKIKCPTLLFQGRLDSTIKSESMNYLYEHINSDMKRKIWLQNNDHAILESPDRMVIISEIIKFSKEI